MARHIRRDSDLGMVIPISRYFQQSQGRIEEVPMEGTTPVTLVQLLGSGGLGFVIGWYVYYINRYRAGDVQISDVLTLIGAIGGAAVTALFPARSDLFGAYGIGLFAGFFLYFLTLVILVGVSPNFDADWFLDGRRRVLDDQHYIPAGTVVTARTMGAPGDPRG
jgi:hypothetical protein